MTKFFPYNDALATRINQEANTLYDKLQTLDVDRLGMPEHCLLYFKGSHFNRLFFSIETSARLLYQAIRETHQDPSELHVMDYGAGVGTLYTLAKMIGCKRVIYNDYLESWRQSAQLIAEAIGIQVDSYITGDIETTLKTLAASGDSCDLIVSRNLIEHIYDLNAYYKIVQQYFPQAILFSSTTANDKNPGTRWQHKKIHTNIEKIYRGFRIEIIQKALPTLEEATVQELATATQGLALDDLTNALQLFETNGQLPNPTVHRTNTCDPTTGLWAEHLISFEEYRAAIEPTGYRLSFRPGFWDTHYRSKIKNFVTTSLNAIITASPALGIRLAPFIYIIAKPIHHE